MTTKITSPGKSEIPASHSRFQSEFNRWLFPVETFDGRDKLDHPDFGRAQQAFAAECDVNNIMSTYNKTGQLPDLIKQDPVYGDFAAAPTYQEALDTVALAEAQFAALSAETRERFANDPARFLSFAEDPSNTPEMIRLGLAVPLDTPSAVNAPLSPPNAAVPASAGTATPPPAGTPKP